MMARYSRRARATPKLNRDPVAAGQQPWRISSTSIPKRAQSSFGASGIGNVAEGIQALREAVEVAAVIKTKSFLISALEVENVPTTAEADRLAQELGALSRAGYRFAFAAPPGAAYGVARMVSVLSEMQGVSVEAFRSDPDALRWLAEGAPQD